MTLFDEELFPGDKAAAIKACSDHLPVCRVVTCRSQPCSTGRNWKLYAAWMQVKSDMDGFRLDQIVQDGKKQ